MQRGRNHADLIALVGWLSLVDVAVLVPALAATPLRPALALPFLFVGPGYAVVAALFPERLPVTDISRRFPLLGRLVLSVGASVGAVLAVGLVLDFTVFGFATVPVLAGVTVLTLAATAVAVRRRRTVAQPAGVTFGAARDHLRRTLGDSPLDVALSGVVVVAVVLAAGAVYGMPAADTTPTEAFLLTPGPDGPVADDYPQTLQRGQPTTLILGAESGTDSATPVTAVVSLQRLDGDDGSVTVTEETVLQTLTFEDPAGGTARIQHTVTPTVTGDLRLTYAVYFGDGSPTGPPDKQVHLQVTVTE
jgi:uncharacterized membrane protein